MKVQSILLLSVFLLGFGAVFAQKSQQRIQYVNKFNQIAVDEMHRTGIPASIKLAQAILESDAGKSVLARKANNHFGIKCGYRWTGRTYYRVDDDYDDQGNPIESCFRAYNDVESSWVAHSEFLTNSGRTSRYDFLFDLDPSDYRKWAHGLKKAGYATNPKYPNLLIKIIEDYELHLFDSVLPFDPTPVIADVKVPHEDKPGATVKTSSKYLSHRILKVNDVDMTYASNGETVLQIANRVQIPIKRILKYNEELYSGAQDLEVNYRVFLQPKRTSFRGRQKVHNVKNGQTMMDISQMYGVKLEKLYVKNRMAFNTEPKAGEKIKIKGWKVKDGESPDVEIQNNPTPQNPQDSIDDFFNEEITATSINDFERPDVSTGGPIFESPRSAFNVKSDLQVQENKTTSDVPKADAIIKEQDLNGGPKKEANLELTPVAQQVNGPSKGGSELITNSSTRYYTVSAGDTLYRISKRFNVTVNHLKESNGLNSNHLNIGQILVVN